MNLSYSEIEALYIAKLKAAIYEKKGNEEIIAQANILVSKVSESRQEQMQAQTQQKPKPEK